MGKAKYNLEKVSGESGVRAPDLKLNPKGGTRLLLLERYCESLMRPMARKGPMI